MWTVKSEAKNISIFARKIRIFQLMNYQNQEYLNFHAEIVSADKKKIEFFKPKIIFYSVKLKIQIGKKMRIFQF